MPSTKETQALHEEMLALLKQFHKICVENNINYSLHGGTLLGAVREKGFIPWDDDIDVSVTREQYERLMPCLAAQCNSSLYLDLSDRIPRFWLKRSDKLPAWLDIFVYDYISEQILAQKLKIAFLRCFAQLLKNKTAFECTRVKHGKWSIKTCAARLLYYLGKVIPDKFKIKAYNNIGKNKMFYGRGQLIHRSNDLCVPMGIVLPKEVMDTYILVPFEDTELMIASKYHEILTSSYGADYMVPKRPSQGEARAHEILHAKAAVSDSLFVDGYSNFHKRNLQQ